MLQPGTIKPRKHGYFKQILSVAAAGFLAIGPACSPARAEQVLKDLAQPVSVTLETALNTETVKSGDSFKAVLTENYRYQQQSLPAGTVFKGHVSKVEPSQRLFRPGFVLLYVDEAVYPDGKKVSLQELDPDGYEKNVHHPKAITIEHVAKSSVPYAGVSVATTIPLKVATSMGGGPIFFISLAAKMATGVVMEFTQYRDNGRSTGKKVALGAFRGTGIPVAIASVNLSPEPAYQAGDSLAFRFGPEVLEALMVSETAAAQTTEPTAAAAVLENLP